MKTSQAKNIDEYIATFPREVQQKLEAMRSAIKHSAPKAEEAIKYAMPTFVMNGNLVHFAAFKNHIGFYPAPMGIKAFEKELSVYKGGKGSVQFPLDKPLPLALIKKIVKFRVQKNQEKTKLKAAAKSKKYFFSEAK
jgi:uncharacterized protein YdhG (YjbR/CyaY superfamily)